jgi:hypothetical protein
MSTKGLKGLILTLICESISGIMISRLRAGEAGEAGGRRGGIMSEKELTLPEVGALLQAEYTQVLEPVSRRRTWTTSRLGVRRDGSVEPVLLLLARLKYGTWDPEVQYPYWRDKNWQNETWENVVLADMQARRRHTSMNPYGVPSNTPEYWVRYRERNAEKLREYHRKRYERNRKALATVQQLQAQGILPSNALEGLPQDPSPKRRLGDLLAQGPEVLGSVASVLEKLGMRFDAATATPEGVAGGALEAGEDGEGVQPHPTALKNGI